MKNIYELLDQVEIDEAVLNEIEAEFVSEIEKEKIKKRLKNEIRKKKFWHNKGIVAAVIVGAVVGGSLCIGITNPTYAAGIPIVGDIFRFLDNGRTGVYDLYKENANEINITKESKGISMTIQEAVFDGRTISYTYEINTDKNLGENPQIGMGPVFDVKDYKGGMTGSSTVKKVKDGVYIGRSSYTIQTEKEAVNCKVDVKEVLIRDGEKEETLRGNWKFEFCLAAVKGIKQNVNKTSEKEEFTVTINNICKTPMSYIIDFTQNVPVAYRTDMDDVTTTLETKDDLGNIYIGEHNGGSGRTDTGTMNFSVTLPKLEEKATKLVITPKIYCTTYKGGVSIDENGKETDIKPVEDKQDRELILEDIIVDLE